MRLPDILKELGAGASKALAKEIIGEWISLFVWGVAVLVAYILNGKSLTEGASTAAKKAPLRQRLKLAGSVTIVSMVILVIALHFSPAPECKPGKFEESSCPSGPKTKRYCSQQGHWDAWAPCASAPPPPPTEALSLIISKENLREGEEAQLAFFLQHDAYVYLFDIYEDGSAALLIPNRELQDNRFDGGVTHHVPSEAWREHDLRLLACPAPGHAVSTETFRLFASPRPIDLKLGRFSGPDFVTLEGGPDGKLAEVMATIERARAGGGSVQAASVAYTISAVAGPSDCKQVATR